MIFLFRAFIIILTKNSIKMMVLDSYEALKEYIENYKKLNKTIGFAPTMGALHEGHISLYQAARPENDIVISSIFVNPTQFNNQEDFEKYPNTIVQDIEKLTQSGLVDALYLPKEKDLYPNGTKSNHYELGEIETLMEGKFRPGHFQGVATVVEALFSQVQPDNAYFGEKDYQQVAVIRKLVELKNLSIAIHSVPTMREENGLAMSSRNLRLSEKGKKDAVLIYETLNEIRHWSKTMSVSEIENRVKEIFSKHPDFELEYFVIADDKTLRTATEILPNLSYRAFLVAHLEGVRLIDNMKIA